ncbi:hypothetical protein [Alicyclobacillus sp. SO9]|uniref:hypothetical protein n=1 Tax=Alicyclobacillus sp. SO9 TaxID=2665646 RepID=UPI0018E717B3|nr:hypothetical protein [Alicyclobacillus sp. SO9]QQE79536.1 hypothetical protein GI364_03305 [Alicyclobacillus sp. SO9]
MHKRGRFLLSGILTSVLTWVVVGPPVFAATAGMASPVGWKKYPFGNYVWDYFIKSGIHFNPLHGTVPTTMNQIANLLEQMKVHIMYLMLAFLDFAIHPKQITGPIVQELSHVLAAGYTAFYTRLLPGAFAIMAIFLLYRFARSHHASILQILLMFVLVSGFAVAFYTHFSGLIDGVTNFDDAASSYFLNVASELGQKAQGSPHVTPNVDPALSVVWDDYVLLPWEAGEFGTSSLNLNQFQVSQQEVGQTYQGNGGKTKHIQPGQNWVSLMLSTNGGGQGRTELAKVLYSSNIPRGHFYQYASEDSPQSSPMTRLQMAAFNLAFPLVSLVPAVFFAWMGALLFALTFGFLLTVVECAVILPLTVIPDYGWNKLLQLLKRAAGQLIMKTLNALYLGLSLFVMNLISNGLSGSTVGQELSLIIISVVLLILLFFRGRFLRELTTKLPDDYRWTWRDRARDVRQEARQKTTLLRSRLQRAQGSRRNRSTDSDASASGGASRSGGRSARRSTGFNKGAGGGTRSSTSSSGTNKEGNTHRADTNTSSRSPKRRISVQPHGAKEKFIEASVGKWTNGLPSSLKAKRVYQGTGRKYLLSQAKRSETPRVDGTSSWTTPLTFDGGHVPTAQSVNVSSKTSKDRRSSSVKDRATHAAHRVSQRNPTKVRRFRRNVNGIGNRTRPLTPSERRVPTLQSVNASPKASMDGRVSKTEARTAPVAQRVSQPKSAQVWTFRKIIRGEGRQRVTLPSRTVRDASVQQRRSKGAKPPVFGRTR